MKLIMDLKKIEKNILFEYEQLQEVEMFQLNISK